MIVLYKKKHVKCYAVIYHKQKNRHLYLLSKEDTTFFGAHRIYEILSGNSNEELQYLDSSLTIHSQIEPHFRWFPVEAIELISEPLTNNQLLSLLKQ